MSNLLTIKNVRGFIDESGTAQLNLEDVSRGLGFTRVATSGNEVIRWERVRDYLSDMNAMPTSGHDKDVPPEFIPENIFYRLAMKARNETADKFQAIVCDEILPAIRKTGTYSAPQLSKELQAIFAIDNRTVKLETRLNDLQDNMPLFNIECDELQSLVRKVGMNCLGGKGSLAYKDRSLRGKVYSDIQSILKREFGVERYKAIKRNQIKIAREIVSNYQLPFVLKMEIAEVNKSTQAGVA